MGQERKPEAGEYKHNDAEHFIWIFERRTRSVICFVFQCGPKSYLTPQLLGFSFVLDRIVHLPVPSETLPLRGKKIWKSCGELRGRQNAGVFIKMICDVRFRVG
jgi:hypothetical protein